MPSFRWQGQDWELPNIQPDTLLKIRPSLFISYFFAIESNKREPATSSNKHFLTEAYKTALERKLRLKPGEGEMIIALRRWKEDKYWTVAHGGPGDSFSTRANPNSLLIPNSQTSFKESGYGHYDSADGTPQKQLECFFWRRDGYCKFSEEDCLYAHHKTGKIKEYNDGKENGTNFRPRQFTPAPQLTKTECFFWGQARRERPWETVLKMYKTYVQRNFGNDKGKHVLAAYARTKLPIPDDLLKKHTLQLDDELSKKGNQGPKVSLDKNGEKARDAATKRPRSSDEDAAPTTPKRVKSEREPVSTPISQQVASRLAHQPSKNDALDVQGEVEAPVRQPARLYSPSMPYEALPQPKFNDTGANSTRAEQAASVDELVSSVSAKIAGNATQGTSPNSMPHANSLTSRPSVLVSPTHTSATTREGHRAAPITEKAADSPQVNGVESRDSRTHTEKNIVSGIVHDTAHAPSPPNTSNSVASKKLIQRSHEGKMHPLPSSRGNNPVVQSSSNGRMIAEDRPASNGISTNGTHDGDTRHGPKRISNGHGSISHGSKPASDKVSVPGGGSGRQTSQLPHSQELATAGKANGDKPLPAGTPGSAASRALSGSTYHEPPQEPLGAHIVRVEALLRGALMELETLKQTMG